MLPRAMFLSNIAGASARHRQGTHSSVRSSHPHLCSMTKPSDTGPALPQHGPLRSDREMARSQLDLFAERGRAIPRRVPDPMAPPAAAPVETLSDDDLLESVPKAGPSNIEAVCSEIVSRCLEAAVPALEALWRRFAGFGVEKPHREQLPVLETLARLGSAFGCQSRKFGFNRPRHDLSGRPYGRLRPPASFRNRSRTVLARGRRIMCSQVRLCVRVTDQAILFR